MPSGILAALYERETHGSGRRIEVTMFEAMVEWMNTRRIYTHSAGARRSAVAPTTRPSSPTAVPRRRRQARHVRHTERARVGVILQRRA